MKLQNMLLKISDAGDVIWLLMDTGLLRLKWRYTINFIIKTRINSYGVSGSAASAADPFTMTCLPAYAAGASKKRYLAEVKRFSVMIQYLDFSVTNRANRIFELRNINGSMATITK